MDVSVSYSFLFLGFLLRHGCLCSSSNFKLIQPFVTVVNKTFEPSLILFAGVCDCREKSFQSHLLCWEPCDCRQPTFGSHSLCWESCDCRQKTFQSHLLCWGVCTDCVVKRVLEVSPLVLESAGLLLSVQPFLSCPLCELKWFECSLCVLACSGVVDIYSCPGWASWRGLVCRWVGLTVVGGACVVVGGGLMRLELHGTGGL